MSFLLLVTLVTIGNLALGFALAVQLGHGPSWHEVSRYLRRLRRSRR